MILISNNLQKYLELPPNAVVRVNMAWVNTLPDLERIITLNAGRDVFLDYPQGRQKPPTPVLTLEDAFAVLERHPNIKYFAVSNVEDIENVLGIQFRLPPTVSFVPKIETLKGITEFGRLVKACNIKVAMLDKEDLFLDVNRDNATFYGCIDKIRNECSKLDVELLELEGVTFIARNADGIRSKP